MFDDIFSFIRNLYPREATVPLHAPVFHGKEKNYVMDCIDSTFVSSVGEYVGRFESALASATGAAHAVAVVNGTSGLHLALHLSGVRPGDEVITQALTFVATANAISYLHAFPVFLDSDPDRLGMSVGSLESFLKEKTIKRDGACFNRRTGRRISACVPMHVFGHPVEIQGIARLCEEFGIPLVEDAAESLGSLDRGNHTGLAGAVGVLSFNGNKIVTCGGGGALITNDSEFARRAKHLSTTAKQPHPWEFFHDEVGFNYRMPNLNAALGLAQVQQLESFIRDKRDTAEMYRDFFKNTGIQFVGEPDGARSNYWLNAILLKNRTERDRFLQEANASGIQARPVWQLMTGLPAFRGCESVDLPHAESIQDRLVNLPSSVRMKP